MYGWESCTIKKAECRRIDAFELLCWRRLLRVPWIARRSHQTILKKISPEHSLEGLMLKLKLQYFGHLMQIIYSFEKTLMLGKIEGSRRGQQRMRWLDGVTSLMDMSCPGVSDGQGSLACCSSWGHKELDTLEGLNWTECTPVFVGHLLLCYSVRVPQTIHNKWSWLHSCKTLLTKTAYRLDLLRLI